ncbi:TRAP transporter substrate-binding protein DctP [Vallitalea okinawensis]|uniref:TRAP transporter substrate-binding protein DctP n=1 Tax=Vallitalea okinawensis TaxID=2078660 RepID=UPI001300AE39|nr:TRAP transporter substrate-binding protein DctP [Vallitalea okinawensis]
MKKILSILMSLILVVGIFTGCGQEEASDKQVETNSKAENDSGEEYVIKLGHVLATDHPVHISLQGASDKIKERTSGKVDIQIYPNGELSSYQDGVESVIAGAPYIFYSSPGQFSDYVPNFAALQAPFLYGSFEEYSALMDTEVISKLKEEADAAGIHTLSLNFVSGFRNLLTDYPVNSVEDIENLKIRVPGNPVFVKPFELMNTNPSSINWSETYTSLQQGVVDAIEGTSNNIYNAKMFEVKNVVTETAHIIDLSGVFIGTKYWDTLPTEYKEIITEEIAKAEVVQNDLAKKADSEFKEKLMAEGVTFNEVDKSSFQEATKSIVLEYEIGQELLDTIAEVNK